MSQSPKGDGRDPLDLLVAFVGEGRVCVLTGAGCSTESGIPDYRGPETRRRARNPIRMEAFLRDPATRQRYWARSYLGWPRLRSAVPNAAHRALAQLEREGLLTGLITQNVDSLHSRAGSRALVELHGALRQVICLDCGARACRESLQLRMQRDNPHAAPTDASTAPDGDADTAEGWVRSFRAPHCEGCETGVLKPDVVFFGDNVPRPRVERAFTLLAQARALLVVGSSLAVYSGYRFVRTAHREGKPIAIVNLGETRGDAAAALRVSASSGRTLEALSTRLTTPRARPA